MRHHAPESDYFHTPDGGEAPEPGDLPAAVGTAETVTIREVVPGTAAAVSSDLVAVAQPGDVAADSTPVSETQPKSAPVEDLGGLTVSDLRAKAREAGVDGADSMKKAELVAALS